MLAVNFNAWRHLCGESPDRDKLIIDARYGTTFRMNFAHDDLLATFAAHQEVHPQPIFAGANSPSICSRTARQCQGIHDETLSRARLARQNGEAGAKLYAYGINDCEPSNAKLTNL